jgi:signal peptidase I
MTEKKKINWLHEIWQLALLGLAVLGFHSAIAKPFYIPSESMLPALLVGDRLVVTKYPYGYSYLSPSLPILPKMEGRLFGRLPERGDIVVVKSPGDHTDYIKRLIGLPGDTIQVKGGVLYLNGKAVRRTALPPIDIVASPNTSCDRFPQFQAVGPDGTDVCRYPRYRETLPNGVSYDVIDAEPGSFTDNTELYRLPPGSVFLMGDNRDNSADSRVPPELGGLGILPIENLSGRAEFITFSLDGSLNFLDPTTWPGAFRGERAFDSLHPDREGEGEGDS